MISLENAKNKKVTGFTEKLSISTGIYGEPIKVDCPNGLWTINGDGTVTDHTNNLMWIQAPWGMLWNHGVFQGKALNIDWTNASRLFGEDTASSTSYSDYKKGSCTVKFAGHDAWRLPTAKEWDSINFNGKPDRSIQMRLFPYYNGGAFWTATPIEKKNYILFKSVIAFKGWFGRAPNDDDARIGYQVLFVRNY